MQCFTRFTRRKQRMLGKTHQGFESTKYPASSIPTKFQTVVISNEERKGFCSQAKRFSSHLCQNENPGPGTYMGLMTEDFNSPSFSKKGTGGLASQTVRVLRNPQRGIPGPNSYNLQSSFINKYSFGRGGSRIFQPPVAVQLHNPKSKTPAPNQYNVSFGGVEKKEIVSVQSVFLSKTGRGNVCSSTLNGPSPCHYNVNNTIIQNSPQPILSCFKSKTSRIYTPLDKRIPGPGSYSPYKPPEPVKRQTLPKIHYLGISARPLSVSKNPAQPGPGQYNIAHYGDPVKQFMSSAVFLSDTSRWSKAMQAHEVPGPGSYKPDISSKQSFLSNHNKNWIPA